MPIITVSREIGAGAATISRKLAEALGCPCIDKEIIHEIGKKLGKDQEEMADFDQDTYNRLSVFMQETLSGMATGGVLGTFGLGPLDWEGMNLTHPYPHTEYEHEEYITVLKSVVEEFARGGNAVLLGRGGQCILRAYPGAIHLRIVADLEDRLKRLIDEQQIDREKATRLITERDESARKFIEDFFDAEWTDPHLYHLTANTSRIPLDTVVDLVLRLAGKTPDHP